MKSNLPVSLLCGLLFSLVGWHGRFAPVPALGQDQEQEKSISVEVTSGRTFAGQLDAQTDAARLWLRSRQGSAVLLRPIEWDRVVQVNVAGADLSGEEFLRIVKAVRQEVAARKETTQPENTQPESKPPESKIVIQGSARSGGFLSVTGTPAGRPPQEPRVRSLAVEAVVANWDADVEVDGLLVYVYPLDGTGAVVPTRGVLQFDLTGQRDQTYRRWRRFTTLGRWSRQVRVEDFGPSGAVYKLEFQGVHPEFDLSVAPRGALHARLSVPGQGTFDTTDAMVRIRPYSSVRDELQHSTGRRFLPEEHTGRGRR